MSQFIFNDIYGNQQARQRYQSHRQYTYFNTVLKLHNKYYQNNQMHNYIFSTRKPTHLQHRLTPIPQLSKPQQYILYNVQKLNNRTFRINRKNKAQENIHRSTIHVQPAISTNRGSVQHRSISNNSNNSIHRDIRKDAEQLKNTITNNNKKKNKFISTNYNNSFTHSNNNINNFTNGKNIGRYDRQSRNNIQDNLNYNTINHQLRSYSHMVNRKL